MNLRQLEFFRAVMIHGTMTRAAEVLGSSQPSVSNQIATLEHQIGFKLFERTKGRLRPTPEAGHFFEVINRIITDLDDAKRTAEHIRDGKLGTLVVATLPGFGLTVLPRVLSRLGARRPKARFVILTRSSEVVRTMFPAQQFDVAVVEHPINNPAVSYESLRFECVCVLPSDHALAKHAVLTPKELDGEPFIALFREHGTTHQLARAFAAEGAKWNVFAETQFFATNCEFVGYGAGVSVVDPITARHYETEALVIRPFEPKIYHEVALVFPLDRPRSRLVDEFVRIFRETIDPYLAAP